MTKSEDPQTGPEETGFLEGWNGQPIRGVLSRRGVFVARDWRDMVLDRVGDIESKARAPARSAVSRFSHTALALVTSVDGRYSDVQSINSEDTVTWAAFGPRTSNAALRNVLRDAFGERPWPNAWDRCFWKRWPHPQTGRTVHGPEPDVTVSSGDEWCFAIEAKWKADLDDSQGAGGSMTQLQMRAAVVQAQVNDPGRRGVLVIAPSPAKYPYAESGTFAKYFQVVGDHYEPRSPALDLGARALTWEQVIQDLAAADGPGCDVINYLNWRLGHLPVRMTDQELWTLLDESLKTVPALATQLPQGYPRKGSAKVSSGRLDFYDDARLDRFWHHLNLPLALYARAKPHDRKVEGVMASLLKTLDDFATTFNGVPGLRKTLQPLWNDPWAQGGPEFWSVVACAFLALSYRANGYQVESFGALIGGGKKDSDIAIRIGSTRTHVDVEVWHSTSLPPGDTDAIRAMLKARADKKAGEKFIDLPDGEFGVAAVVCVTKGSDMQQFDAYPDLAGLVQLDNRPRRFGFVYWLCGMSAGDVFFFDLRSKPLGTMTNN